MTRINFLFVAIFLAVFGEVFVGSFGIMFPLSALLVFYITSTYSWRWGIACAFISGILVDSLTGSSLFVTPVSLTCVVLISLFWLYYIEINSLLIHIIPGAFIAIVYLFPFVCSYIIKAGFNFWGILDITSNLIFCIMLCAVLLPMEIVLLDTVSHALQIDLYSNAKNKLSGRD